VTQEGTPVPGRILVVDDDEFILQLIRVWLESSNFEVITASEETSALQVVETQSIDLSILDLNLPTIDGISLMEDIHSIVPEMPVIIQTGYGSIESAVEAVKKGAYHYLTKPLNRQILIFEISRALENRQLTDEITRLKGLLRAKYALKDFFSQEEIKPLEEARACFEENYLTRLLEITGGSIGGAAQLAGIHRADLYNLIKKYNLRPEDFKRP
jgi:DNA-binding NtrC family response regulator